MDIDRRSEFTQELAKAVRNPRLAYSFLTRVDPIHFITGREITDDDLEDFAEEFRGEEETLIVYIEFSYDDLLPNATELPDHHGDYDKYLEELENVEGETYSQIVASGVLEHVSNPEKFLNECYRILEPGGQLYVSASSTFSIHCGPDDYFHVTHYGMEELLNSKDWSEIEIRASCNPFKTLGILLQRILFQCKIPFILRLPLSLLAYSLPFLDRFIVEQYHDRSFESKSKIDSMMPSNIHSIVKK